MEIDHINAILKDPSNPILREQYADFLEEHGRPEAASLHRFEADNLKHQEIRETVKVAEQMFRMGMMVDINELATALGLPTPADVAAGLGNGDPVPPANPTRHRDTRRNA